MQIRGSVHLIQLVSVTSTPPVLRLHLKCVHATQPAATGVNAITDTPGMDLPAQVSYLKLFIGVMDDDLFQRILWNKNHIHHALLPDRRPKLDYEFTNLDLDVMIVNWLPN